jgi:uncharacterized membrane protein YccC
MPSAQNNPGIDARRFAALLAGFDLGNACEEEALSKARVLRRMAANAGMRVVDVMELPEVKRAIDDQLRPKRTESAGLREALEQAAALREELTERTRDVRKLAELLRQREEEAQADRKQPPAVKAPPNAGPGPRVSTRAARKSRTRNNIVGAIVGGVCCLIGEIIGWYLSH